MRSFKADICKQKGKAKPHAHKKATSTLGCRALYCSILSWTAHRESASSSCPSWMWNTFLSTSSRIRRLMSTSACCMSPSNHVTLSTRSSGGTRRNLSLQVSEWLDFKVSAKDFLCSAVYLHVHSHTLMSGREDGGWWGVGGGKAKEGKEMWGEGCRRGGGWLSSGVGGGGNAILSKGM